MALDGLVTRDRPVTAGAASREGAPSRAVGPREDRLDALRGLAIVGVVAIHVATSLFPVVPGPRLPAALLVAPTQLFESAVPIFFMVTGVVLAGRPRAGEDRWLFLRSRLRRLALPLLAWAVVAVVVDAALGTAPPAGGRGWLTALLLGDRNFALYFLVAAVQVSVVIALLPRRAAARQRVVVGLVAVQALAVLALQAFAGPTSRPAVSADRYANYIGLFWVGYAGLGILAAPRLRRLARLGPGAAACLLAVALPVWAMSALAADRGWTLHIYESPCCLVLAPIVALLAWRALTSAPAPLTGRLAALGRLSYGIYLGQVVVLPVVGRGLRHTWSAGPGERLLLWPAVTAAALVGCALVAAVVRRLPLGNAVLGEDARRPRPH